MLRKAGISDLEAVSHLAILLWPHHDFIELKCEMKEIILDKEAVIILSFDGDKPNGFAQCQLRHDYVEGTSTSPVGYLEGVFVLENYRRKGIAASLLRECESWAKENGCTEFASDCEIENTESYNFHMKAGFGEANRIICFKKKIM